MKPATFRSRLFIALLLFILLGHSCKKESGDEIVISDFASIEKLFNKPPAEYTSAPFFVWNAEITKEEIDLFLADFKKQGSEQVFVHPRPGLINEYLSDEWFDLFRYTVDKGKELGMKVWIYDENSYPSGFAGGHVPAEMPESYNQGQGLRMLKLKTLPDSADKYFIVLKDEGGIITDLSGNIASEKGRSGKYIAFFKTYHGKSDWYGGFPYVDLLHKGVTQKFIELTMTGYEKIAGDEFGKTVPGTFTDEPQISSPGGIRYTPDLFVKFQERWGYDLTTSLPSLFEETGEWKKVRHNYTQVLLEMFIERWAKPWYEYCESKDLKFTGHYWEHEWPNMRLGGDNMAMYIYHHVPAIDMLFNQFNDSTPDAQFGNIRSVKELASAANQAGRTRTLSETYGGSGWDLTFAEMKRNGDWEYALGVNLMNQHLTYFSMAGARKYDYPPTFDYHEPWWNYYRFINDHFARLSLALSAGRQDNDVLVLEPTTTAWLYDSYARRNPKVDSVGQSFQTFMSILEKAQVEYDLGSESIMSELGKVKGPVLVVGNASYSRIVIPPDCENINRTSLELLVKFVKAGGSLIAFSTPHLLDGSQSDELLSFFEQNKESINFAGALNNEFIDQYLRDKNIRFHNSGGGQLYHHARVLNDGKLVFLINSDMNEKIDGSFSVNGVDAAELNTLSGKIAAYPFEPAGDEINIRYSLPPAASLLLFIPSANKTGLTLNTKPDASTMVTGGSDLLVKRNRENVLTIDFCDLSLGKETVRDLHVFTASDMAFKRHGLKNGNPWNHSVQYRKNIIEKDTFGINTGFIAEYRFTIKDLKNLSSIKAVVERPDLWKVELNGSEIKPVDGEWWLDRSFAVFRIGDLVKVGVNTLALKASPMKIHAEIEPVYILGDFSVLPATKGWVITGSPKELKTGSWISQGLPFYSWDVSYSREYNIENAAGRYIIKASDWKGTVSEVIVNGKTAGLIAFPPYICDVSELITTGKNTIELKVTGSLRNLQGPFHNNPPAGFASPWNWRNVKFYPSGSDYSLYDYGLMTEFELFNGK